MKLNVSAPVASFFDERSRFWLSDLFSSEFLSLGFLCGCFMSSHFLSKHRISWFCLLRGNFSSQHFCLLFLGFCRCSTDGKPKATSVVLDNFQWSLVPIVLNSFSITYSGSVCALLWNSVVKTWVCLDICVKYQAANPVSQHISLINKFNVFIYNTEPKKTQFRFQTFSVSPCQLTFKTWLTFSTRSELAPIRLF